MTDPSGWRRVARGLFGEAGWVALASIVAAAAVLLRDMSISRTLGRGLETDTLLAGLVIATTVAQLVPSTFQTAVFSVAVQTKLTAGPRAMSELLGRVSVRFVALAGLLALPMVLLAEPIATALAPRAGAATLAAVLPVLALFVMALAITELGRSIFALEKRYVAFAAVGCLGNLVLAGLIVWRHPADARAAAPLAGLAFALSVGVAWTLVLSRGLVRSRRVGPSPGQLGRIYRQAVPSLGAGMLTIGMSVVDQYFTMSLGGGSYATLAFAQRWPMFATQLPALALGTVLLRSLAEDVVQLDPRDLKRRVRQTFALGVAVGAAATLGGLLIGPVLVRLTLQGGEFTTADADAVVSVQRMLFLQAPFYIGGIVYLRVLNALQLNHIGFAIGAAMLALNGLLDWALTRVWTLGVHGIALATVLVYVFSGLCLVAIGEYALRRHQPRPAAPEPPSPP